MTCVRIMQQKKRRILYLEPSINLAYRVSQSRVPARRGTAETAASNRGGMRDAPQTTLGVVCGGCLCSGEEIGNTGVGRE